MPGFLHPSRWQRTATVGGVCVAVAAIPTAAVTASVVGHGGGRARPAAAAGCRAERLPTLGGRYAEVTAGSPRGLLAGIAQDPAGRYRAVLWRSGHVQALPVGLVAALPTAVSDSGIVVGTAQRPGDRHPVAWAWTRGTTVILRSPAGVAGVPLGVAPDGTVVGVIHEAGDDDGPAVNEEERAVLWATPRAAYRVLPPLPGDPGARATAIGAGGVVAGVSVGRAQTAVRWIGRGPARAWHGVGGPWAALQALGGGGGGGGGAGTGSTPSGRSVPLVWSASGAVSQLPLPRGAVGGAVTATSATASAGTAQLRAPGAGIREQAVRWAGGRARVLPPVVAGGFAGVSGAATALAADGTVAGYSSDAVGARVATVWRCP